MIESPLPLNRIERLEVTTIKDIKITDDSEKIRTGRYILAWRNHRNITLASIVAEGTIAIIVLLFTRGVIYKWSLAVFTTYSTYTITINTNTTNTANTNAYILSR